MVEAGIFAPGERLELLDGDLITMTPQKSAHATAVRLCEIALQAAFGPGHEVRSQMPLALDPNSEPEPDVAVVTGAPEDYWDAHPTTALLIVEVADTTLAYDREQKGRVYARAGVREYWIVNLTERCVEVYRDPAPLADARSGWAYRTAQQSRPGDHLVPLAAPGARIPVTSLLR